MHVRDMLASLFDFQMDLNTYIHTSTQSQQTPVLSRMLWHSGTNTHLLIHITHIQACTPCPIGTYKDSIGPHACTPCPQASSTSVIGASLISNCTCAEGYGNAPVETKSVTCIDVDECLKETHNCPSGGLSL